MTLVKLANSRRGSQHSVTFVDRIHILTSRRLMFPITMYTILMRKMMTLNIDQINLFANNITQLFYSSDVFMPINYVLCD